jgi:hypothetical protein
MKTYFIVQIDDMGGVSGKISQDLVKDFIKPYGITYSEDYKDDDTFGMNPIISDVSFSRRDSQVYIFEMNLKNGYQSLTAQFNFYQEPYDDIEDFLNDNWRHVIMNESIQIKKFRNF